MSEDANEKVPGFAGGATIHFIDLRLRFVDGQAWLENTLNGDCAKFPIGISPSYLMTSSSTGEKHVVELDGQQVAVSITVLSFEDGEPPPA